jgi:16S rRNA (cytosine967-C5)-methyltransferase
MTEIQSPRLFPNTVAGVLEGLEITFGKGIYADKVVERLLRQNKKWGSRDRSFVAEHTYEMVRWWGLLWALLGQEPSTKRKDLQKLFGIYWMWKGYSLPDWPKFDSIRNISIDERIGSITDTATLESYSSWFSALAEEQLGADRWASIARAMNIPNTVNIRVNSLKATQEQVINALSEAGIKTFPHPSFSGVLCIEGRPRLNNISAFQEGWFEVQDAGSQVIAPFLNPTPGSTVIDACAGAGGKTLHLGELMENQGTLIAMDVEGRKLGELLKRTQRSGLSIVKTRAWEETGVLAELENTADYLLLDVPCSGTGVIKREPDTKWKLQPDHLERLNDVQYEIIHSYSRMVKPGGTMVYATCSILPQENRGQIDSFLLNNDKFKLIEDQSVDPAEFNDGFYMAKLQRIA